MNPVYFRRKWTLINLRIYSMNSILSIPKKTEVVVTHRYNEFVWDYCWRPFPEYINFKCTVVCMEPIYISTFADSLMYYYLEQDHGSSQRIMSYIYYTHTLYWKLQIATETREEYVFTVEVLINTAYTGWYSHCSKQITQDYLSDTKLKKYCMTSSTIFLDISSWYNDVYSIIVRGIVIATVRIPDHLIIVLMGEVDCQDWGVPPSTPRLKIIMCNERFTPYPTLYFSIPWMKNIFWLTFTPL